MRCWAGLCSGIAGLCCAVLYCVVLFCAGFGCAVLSLCCGSAGLCCAVLYWGCDGAVRGCAGVTESTGVPCQRNDKTGTRNFPECEKAQRGNKNVGKGFGSGVLRHELSLARETPHRLL